MADVAKSGTPALATVTPPPNCQQAGLYAGEALGAFDACYIKNSDNKVYKAIGTTLGADAAQVHGYAWFAADVGEAVTLIWDVAVRYGANLPPGKRLYLSATAGGGLLADAASTGGVGPVGHTIDATRAFLRKSQY